MTGERTSSAAREYKASCLVNKFTSNIQEMLCLMIQLQGCLNDMSACDYLCTYCSHGCESHDGILFFSNGWFAHCKLLENVPSYAKYPKVPKSDVFILIQIQQHNKPRTDS